MQDTRIHIGMLSIGDIVMATGATGAPIFGIVSNKTDELWFKIFDPHAHKFHTCNVAEPYQSIDIDELCRLWLQFRNFAAAHFDELNLDADQRHVRESAARRLLQDHTILQHAKLASREKCFSERQLLQVWRTEPFQASPDLQCHYSRLFPCGVNHETGIPRTFFWLLFGR